jgi:hypothetical protein
MTNQLESVLAKALEVLARSRAVFNYDSFAKQLNKH